MKRLVALKTLNQLSKDQNDLTNKIETLRFGVLLFIVLAFAGIYVLYKFDQRKVYEYIDSKIVVEETLEKEEKND